MNYHDVLARFGSGSAHPGGFAATLDLMKYCSFPEGASILEIGCGTGRTSCYLATLGYVVTAIDNHPIMIEKAKMRAEAEQAQVQFLQANATCLPFDSGSFDVVFIESVTIFLDPEAAIEEYARVLKQGGQILDRELCLLAGSHEGQYHSTHDRNLGIHRVPKFQEWEYLFNRIFREVQIYNPQPFTTDFSYPDPCQMTFLEPEVLSDKDALKLVEQYEQFVAYYQKQLGDCVIIGRK